jgi:hypothetical protein
MMCAIAHIAFSRGASMLNGTFLPRPPAAMVSICCPVTERVPVCRPRIPLGPRRNNLLERRPGPASFLAVPAEISPRTPPPSTHGLSVFAPRFRSSCFSSVVAPCTATATCQKLMAQDLPRLWLLATTSSVQQSPTRTNTDPRPMPKTVPWTVRNASAMNANEDSAFPSEWRPQTWILRSGGPCKIRTCDLRIKSPLLDNRIDQAEGT